MKINQKFIQKCLDSIEKHYLDILINTEIIIIFEELQKDMKYLKQLFRDELN